MMKEKFFILVLYNCNLKESASYKSITQSLERENEKAYLYIYDNSFNSQIIIKNNSVWSEINYIHDSHNSGLSIAYNTGATYANNMGYEWVILLDQDTEFSLDFISELNIAMLKYPGVVLFAPILKLKSGNAFSPSGYKFKRGYSVNLSCGLYSLKKYSPVNSGLVINLLAFNNVGGYVNEIKLDFADFQFIERLKRKYELFYLINSIAIQDFSNDESDMLKNISRFKLYLDGAKKCNRESVIDDLLYFYSAIRHTMGLTLKFQNPVFLKTFYLNYLKNKI